MTWFWRLFLLFTLVPVVEIALLIEIGQVIGTWVTVGLVVLSGVVGSAMARQQGLQVVHRARQELGAGQVPAGRLLDGVFVLVGGVFLVTPGFITDIAGLLVLVPAVRARIKTWLADRLRRWLEDGVFVVFRP